MSLSIAQELIDFETSLNGRVDGLSKNITDIKDALTSIGDATTNASNGFSQNYESKNKSVIINSFTNLNTICNNINTSVSNDLSKIVSESSSMLSKIIKLKEYKKAVDDANDAFERENKKEDPSYIVLSSNRSIINSYTNSFNSLHTELLNQLHKLKSMDADLSFTTKFAQTSAEQLKSNLKFGTFELKKYKASNGIVIQYYLYVPDYDENVKGLPVNMYMHGSGMGENSINKLTGAGLGKYIKEKKIIPSGIVVIPLAPTGRDYESKSFRNALAELPFAVAEEYDADTTRISLSGHSYGSITAYRLVNENPGKFSAIVPISGSNTVTSAFKNISVWAFHGTDDTKANNTNYGQAVDKVKEINQRGGTAVMHTYKGGNHAFADVSKEHRANIIEETFTKEHDFNGEKINPLEWAFQQSTV